MSGPPSYNDVYDKKQPSAPPPTGYAPVDTGYGQQSAPGYPGNYGAAPYPAAAPYPGGAPYPAGAPYPSGAPYGQPQPAPAPGPYVDAPKNVAPVATAGTYSSSNEETGGFTVGGSFSDKNVRRLFVRKVFITLGLQLLVTFGIVCIFTFVDGVPQFVQNNIGIYYAAYGVFLVVYIMLVCCGSIRRKHPTNIIFLIIFTLAFSYMVGTIASFYDTMSVVIALGVTVLVCGGMIIFSMQTKFDFTACSGVLFCLSMVLFLFGFITIFTYSQNYYIQIVYGALGALVFSLFLAFDVQLIMGGKRYELDPEEYIYGALNLYIDVVYIFLFLLQIIGGSNN